MADAADSGPPIGPERVMRRLMALARPHWVALGSALLCGMVALGCILVIPELTRRLVDDAILRHRPSLIWPLGLATLGLGILRAFMNFLRRNLAGATSVRIEANLRARLFAHLQGLPISFHDQWQSGQLLARATSDLNSIRLFLGYALVFLSFVVVVLLGVGARLVTLDARLAVLSLGLVVPFALAGIRFNGRMEDISARSRDAVGELANVVEESVGGVRILKAFGQEDRAVRRLELRASELRSINLKGVDVRSNYIPVMAFVANLIWAVLLGVGGLEVIHRHLSLGNLVAFYQYLAFVIVPLRYVGWMLALGQQATAAGRRVFEVLETQPSITDPPHARALPAVMGEITLDRVRFIYPGAGLPALDDVSLTIRAGETVALVGMSGSGKSTIAALLPRFADPTAGRVLIDGIDVRTVSLSSLRSQIGVVFDEPVLFSASVWDNIAFGDPNASDEDVRRAAAAAGAARFIENLPEGYDTRVGEEGFSLSGGQRQRLALARALLFRPRILVLDDPLSSVDVKTEAEIEENLATLLRGRTTLLIAHRPSTVSMADRVVLLEQGRVTASGTHAELLASEAGYRQVLAAELDLDEMASNPR
ncbi:MAG: ABC transporter ATP-binding protein [Acidimicrobiales bacterium]